MTIKFIDIKIDESRDCYWFQNGKCLERKDLDTKKSCSSNLRVRTTRKAIRLSQGIFNKYPDISIILIIRYCPDKRKKFRNFFLFRDWETQKLSKKGIE